MTQKDDSRIIPDFPLEDLTVLGYLERADFDRSDGQVLMETNRDRFMIQACYMGADMSGDLFGDGFTVGFSPKEVTAWGGMALMKHPPDRLQFREALCHFGAFVTDLSLPSVDVWRTYRGRADAENRIKELKVDFGLDALNMKEFWVTEAALSFAMPAYNLMRLLCQAVMRSRVQHILSTLHGKVFAVGGTGKHSSDKNRLLLSLPGKKRAWFSGLWANASNIPCWDGQSNSNGKSGII